MEPTELQELKDAVARYALGDVQLGRLLSILLGHLSNLHERLTTLEQGAAQIAPLEKAMEAAKGEK